jgi:hypothetical protein
MLAVGEAKAPTEAGGVRGCVAEGTQEHLLSPADEFKILASDSLVAC